jgi:hypothetical protein
MLKNLHCKCHICKVEHHLFKSLAEPRASVQFSTLALNSPALARFSNVSELLTDLHAQRPGDFANPSQHSSTRTAVPDELIIRLSACVYACTTEPTRAGAWFRELESEDIAQQISRCS